MMLYPGNKSEKPYLRKAIEDAKSRFDISGKTVQVADKGLNCARNIYAAAKKPTMDIYSPKACMVAIFLALKRNGRF